LPFIVSVFAVVPLLHSLLCADLDGMYCILGNWDYLLQVSDWSRFYNFFVRTWSKCLWTFISRSCSITSQLCPYLSTKSQNLPR